MPTFFERVRAALAPEGYQVEGDHELGSGGMGMVVRAWQVGLHRLVAVKVIRPEMHTAVAVARFQREAQTLAKLRNPHIVLVIASAETKDGLPYYVMEHLQGQTLADRLRTGPLPPEQALTLGRHLLDALAHAHAHDVIHRDVKPSNVFWDGENAVLVDFGIAKRLSSDGKSPDTPYTEPGWVPGTPDYMAPEQRAHGEATRASDQYAAALVIFEAFAGRHWVDALQSKASVWRGVPFFRRSVVARALHYNPEKRWPSVATFRHKLRAIWPWKQLLAGAIAAVMAASFWPSTHGLELRIATLADACSGVRAGTRAATALVRELQGNPDFFTKAAGWSWPDRGPTMRAGVAACVHNDSIGASVALSFPTGVASSTIVARDDTAHIDRVAVTLAVGIMREIWNRETRLDSLLPVGALPRSARGVAGWLAAERLFAQARWGEADNAYRAAADVDSTCWLCGWRLAQVDKWVGRPFDTTRYAGVLNHLAAFPSAYQTVIRAAREPLRMSLDSLRAVARRRPAFLAARFMYADEMYHRGPLIGFSLRDAIEALQEVLNVRPDFLPAVEHLAWATTAAGKEREARGYLRRLMESGTPHDPYSGQLRALLTLGVTCRFESDSVCNDAIATAVAGADPIKYPDLAAAPRYMMTFDAPRAAITLGGRFAARTDAPALVESGLVAEVSGYLALGMPDSARATANLLHGLGRPELNVLPAELDGALVLLDPQPREAAARWAGINRELATHTRSAASTAETRRRAAWMLLLLARRSGSLQDSMRYIRLIEGEAGRRPLGTLLDADRIARQGHIAEALRLTDVLTPLQADSLGEPVSVDPFFRSVLHLLRADWYDRVQDRDAVLQELQWSDNNDDLRPNGPPQVADIDWGLHTLARWRQARVLDAKLDPGRCEAYRAVTRAWASGEPPYRARADSAARRVAALSCPVTS